MNIFNLFANKEKIQAEEAEKQKKAKEEALKKIDEKNRTLTRAAGIIAYTLSTVPDIKNISLTGSLARREVANDIDIIVLHSFDEKLVFSSHLNRKKDDEPFESQDRLEETLPLAVIKSLRHICLLANVAADLFFAHEKILVNCDYLQSLPASDSFKDFYKRIFCELPSSTYMRDWHGFAKNPLLHNNGKCCPPEVAWQTVFEARKKREAEKKEKEEKEYRRRKSYECYS